MDTVGTPFVWGVFAAVIVVMLVLDLGVFHRRAHSVTVREASIWTVVWIAIALVFNGLVAVRFGGEAGQAFITGYLIEKALSVDNLFVFYALFRAFRVEPVYQHRLLFWGILGAIVLRTGMVFGGSYMLQRWTFLVYVFGGILILTGWKMLRRQEGDMHPEQGRTLRILRKVIPTSREPAGSRLFVREDGRFLATPLFIVLLLIEASDVVFALDSILAIFAVTTDPFIVLTSNVFAILGMRSLYFVLATLARRFDYLQPGLALVLVFVGVKMASSRFFHIPVVASLGVVVLLLGGSIVASLVKERRLRSGRRPAAAGPGRLDPPAP